MHKTGIESMYNTLYLLKQDAVHFPLGLHCACVYVLIFESMWETEEKKKKKKSGRVNGLIRDVQVQPRHFECASESERSASYRAGLLLTAATTPPWPQRTQEQLADLRQTQRWFLLWLTDPLSALLPRITKRKKMVSVMFTSDNKKQLPESGHKTLFHKGKGEQSQVLWRFTRKKKTQD